VIGGLAIGAAIGTGLRKLFGEAKAVRAEEAAAEGGILLMHIRQQFEQEKGRPMTAAETKKLFNTYEQGLAELGFEQQPGTRAWFRPRSAIETFLG